MWQDLKLGRQRVIIFCTTSGNDMREFGNCGVWRFYIWTLYSCTFIKGAERGALWDAFVLVCLFT